MKKWYTSKTLWFNFIAITAIIANALWGVELDAELQAAMATTILAIINIILRIATKEPVK
jgi:hypothetical protein